MSAISSRDRHEVYPATTGCRSIQRIGSMPVMADVSREETSANHFRISFWQFPAEVAFIRSTGYEAASLPGRIPVTD